MESFSKSKILFLVQLPPPLHGVSTMNKYLIESKPILDEFEISIVQLKFSKSLSDLRAISLIKLVRMFVIGFRIIKKLFFLRPEAVYYTITPTGNAFYRDAVYVIILKMFKLKRIYHLHGKGIKNYANKRKINKILYKFVFKNSYVICMSDMLHDELDAFHPKNIFTVNNGIEVINYEEKKADKVQLLFLSNLIEDKGLFDFLSTLKYLKDLEPLFYATIIGNPSNVSERQLLDFIKSNNITNITYEGAKYGNDKYEYLKKPTILIFPTRNDTFPLVILEAMQFGAPVISTVEGAIPDIIDDTVTGFLVPKSNPEAIAEKVRFLLNNPTERIKMGENGKNKFQNRYKLSIFEKNVKSVFHTVITSNPLN